MNEVIVKRHCLANHSDLFVCVTPKNRVFSVQNRAGVQWFESLPRHALPETNMIV